jgi:hypothetical protein
MRRLERLVRDPEKLGAAKRAVEYTTAHFTHPPRSLHVADRRVCDASVMQAWQCVDLEWAWPAPAEPVRIKLSISARAAYSEPVRTYFCSALWRPKWREFGVSKHIEFCGDFEERAFEWVVKASAAAIKAVKIARELNESAKKRAAWSIPIDNPLKKAGTP